MNLQLVRSDYFGDTRCDFYQQEEELFMTREQIGEALEYPEPRKAIQKIHARHSDRLDNFSGVVKLGSPSGIQKTFIYSPRGVYEICRWSRQPKADAFIDWVWDMVEAIRTGQFSLIYKRIVELENKVREEIINRKPKIQKVQNKQAFLVPPVQVITEWITENIENFKSRKYGFIENNHAYIYPKIFEPAIARKGYSPRIFLRELANDDMIATRFECGYKRRFKKVVRREGERKLVIIFALQEGGNL